MVSVQRVYGGAPLGERSPHQWQQDESAQVNAWLRAPGIRN